MAKSKLKLNKAGVRELLRSGEMQAECKKYADNALSSLGSGYEVTSMVGKNRANAEVRAESFLARRENSKTNSIAKAVGV